MSIKLLIADDHEAVRSGLRNYLTPAAFKIVAEATSGEAAVRLTLKHKPDVVLLDVRMPDGDGLAALSRIKLECPTTPVVMFSAFDDPAFVARCVALGASGFLNKTAPRAEVLAAIEKAAGGEMLWSREELRRASGALAVPRQNGVLEISLTSRESDILKQIADGATNKDIANALSISYETVKENVQVLLRKLGVTDRTQAAVWAVRAGAL